MSSIRNMLRLLQIGWILARYDALFIFRDMQIAPALPLLLTPFVKRSKDAKGVRLALALEALGPSFIKLGQTLSTRADLVGEEIALALANLRDRLPPFDSAIAKQILESELGKPLSEIFQSFTDAPIAAASIAQVHEARLHDGSRVAVKILRPGVEKAFKRDIDLLQWLARLVEKRLPEYRRLKPREVVQTFAQSVAFELDLRYEAAAATEMAKNTANDSGFRVPEIYWDITSESVLVMQWMSGTPIHDVAALKAKGFDLDIILSKLSENFFKHVFRYGFFHADMHPGNLFVDDSGDVIAVDFGIMGRLNWQTRIYVAEILRGFLKEDYTHVARVHFRAGYVPAHQSVEDFALACMAIAKPILNKPVNEISIGRLLGQLFKVTETFQMETRPELLLLQKTMVVVEGVGRMLNPNINMWEMARQPIEDWASANLGVQGKAKTVFNHLRELAELAPALIKKFEEELHYGATHDRRE